MKKTLFIVLTLMWSNVFAETLNIIVSGKPGGTFHTRAMLMRDALIELGHEVNLINAGNLSKSAQIFKTTNDAVIMPWIDSANVKENLQPNANSFGVLEYRAPIIFCSKKYKNFSAEEIVIGYSASWPTQIFDSLSLSINKPVKSIPYRNSGDLVLGLVSDDVDYVAISLSKLGKLPQGSCFAVTNDINVQGIDPLDEIVKHFDYNYINQHAYWLQKNNDVDLLRSILIDAINTADYKKWIESKLFISNFVWQDEDIIKSQQGAKDWGLQ